MSTQINSSTGTAVVEPAGPQLAMRIRKLCHHYGETDLAKQVLFDINLDIKQGEIVIMTGPSGCGKTTLLTLVGTLRTVQSGSLQILGNELKGANANKLVDLRRDIGFIYQDHNLFDSLTAFQNVKMAMELFDFDRAETKSRIVNMLTAVGLKERIYYKPGSLSGGQKQRVAVARGLVHTPKLILADEPTAALDEQTGRDVVTLFQKMTSEDGCTVLMVTHDNRILDVADRIVSMVDGRIKSNVLVRESLLICEFLQRCFAFEKLTPRTLSEVADRMTCEQFLPGDVVIKQGDEKADKFYLITEGTVDVLLDDGLRTRVVATIGRGDFFGEAALIHDKPRNASVIARENLEVYTLGKEDFKAVLAKSATLNEEIRKALAERQ